jgi:hypothetical protein
MMLPFDVDIRILERACDASMEHMRGIKRVIGSARTDEYMVIIDRWPLFVKIVSEGKPYLFGHREYLRYPCFALNERHGLRPPADICNPQTLYVTCPHTEHYGQKQDGPVPFGTPCR